MGEPFTSLLAVAAAFILGRAGDWSKSRSENDNAAALALSRLAQSVEHIDKSIVRIEASMTRSWEKIDSHEHRITSLEANSNV